MPLSPSRIEECMRQCQQCHDACVSVLFTYCLEKGGRHMAAEHVRLMMDCIVVCRTVADMLRRGSAFFDMMCQLCAEICVACALSCERFRDYDMQRCADVCRKAAALCRQLQEMEMAAA